MLAARAGLDLEPRAVWLLYRLADREATSTEAVSARLKVDPAILHQGVDTLVAAGMVERVVRDGSHSVELTPVGEEAIEKLTIARRQSLTEVLEGWDPLSLIHI